MAKYLKCKICNMVFRRPMDFIYHSRRHAGLSKEQAQAGLRVYDPAALALSIEGLLREERRKAEAAKSQEKAKFEGAEKSEAERRMLENFGLKKIDGNLRGLRGI